MSLLFLLRLVRCFSVVAGCGCRCGGGGGLLRVRLAGPPAASLSLRWLSLRWLSLLFLLRLVRCFSVVAGCGLLRQPGLGILETLGEVFHLRV